MDSQDEKLWNHLKGPFCNSLSGALALHMSLAEIAQHLTIDLLTKCPDPEQWPAVRAAILATLQTLELMADKVVVCNGQWYRYGGPPLPGELSFTQLPPDWDSEPGVARLAVWPRSVDLMGVAPVGPVS